MKDNKEQNMKSRIREIMILVRIKVLNIDEGTNQILSLVAENTEGVSYADTKSGVLHHVRESHASDPTGNETLASGELPLEKRTEAKEVKYCQGGCGTIINSGNFCSHGCTKSWAFD